MVQKIQVLLNHHRVITLGIFSLILLFACKPETAVVNVSTVPTATSLASTIEKDTASLKYIMGKLPAYYLQSNPQQEILIIRKASGKESGRVRPH